MSERKPYTLKELDNEIYNTRQATTRSAPEEIKGLLAKHLDAAHHEIIECRKIIEDWIRIGRL
jgi:hypothetical protein